MPSWRLSPTTGILLLLRLLCYSHWIGHDAFWFSLRRVFYSEGVLVRVLGEPS